MTRDEFAQAYAARSGVTLNWLYQHGRYAAPCDCGEEGCEGWQMAYASDERMPEPTPAQRGELDRYQDQRRAAFYPTTEHEHVWVAHPSKRQYNCAFCTARREV